MARPNGLRIDGILGDVYAMYVYNDELYVGGNILRAGNYGQETANPWDLRHLAKWNGIEWLPVPDRTWLPGYATSFYAM